MTWSLEERSFPSFNLSFTVAFIFLFNQQVRDPLYGNEFDLSDLYTKAKDHVIKGSQVSYMLNVCGPLVGDCGASDKMVGR